MAVASAMAPGPAGPGASSLEELAQFRRWSIFLPRTVSEEAERNAVYVKSRQIANPGFFDKMRERLDALLGDCGLLQAAGAETHSSAIVEALEAVLHGQWTAMGFLSNRQFHKALVLGELCLKLVEALAAPQQDLLFWRVLCRANLGEIYARFKKADEARVVLREGLELVEDGVHPAGAAICYAHLSHVERSAYNMDEALRLADLGIEASERFIYEMQDVEEDREAKATALATAYSVRGSCDAEQERYDHALAWFGRALECLDKHTEICADSQQIAAHINNEIDRMKTLQSLTKGPAV